MPHLSSPAADTTDDVERRQPAALRVLVVGAALSVLLLIGLPVGMLLDHEATMASVLRSRPDLPPEHRGFALAAVIIYAAVLHALDVALVVWFTVKTWSGRRWARIALSIYLVAASVLGLLSATAGTPFLIVVVVTDVIHMIMLCLLWLPQSLRAYFRPRRLSNG